MAFAQSFTESGSDEVKDGIVDACSYCATKGKLQPATHFCFDCGVYGRYICGECLQNHNMFVNNHVAEVIAFLSSSRRKQLQTDLVDERQKSESLAKKLREASQDFDSHKTRFDKLQKEKQELQQAISEQQQRIFNMERQLEDNHAEQFLLRDHLKRQTGECIGLKENLKEALENNIKLTKEKKHLEKKHEAHMASMYETMADEKRKHNSDMQKLTKDRDDIIDRFDKLQKEKQELQQEISQRQQRIFNMERQLEDNHAEQFMLQEHLKRQTGECIGLKENLKEALENNITLTEEKKHLEKKHEAYMASMYETMADAKRKHDIDMQKFTKDRDDIIDRYSKLAGAKLSDQNAEIPDLSDPNRAMKLSERFGQLYDDEWTNAFETLLEKKIGLSLKGAIELLLRFLQDCWSFCSSLLTSQMESLHNVFLHPAQNMAKIDLRKNVGGLKEHSIGSKEEKALRELRRMIDVSPAVIEEVKQSLLSEAKSWGKEKTGYVTKHIEACAPYIQRCAEVCWLMAVHDPPLYMKMDVKPGEKIDPNVYTVYSSSGNIIDFLVWPSLSYGKDGGLLAKGIAEPQRIVGKKK